MVSSSSCFFAPRFRPLGLIFLSTSNVFVLCSPQHDYRFLESGSFYEILDFENFADVSSSDVRRAYHRKALVFHPDKRRTKTDAGSSTGGPSLDQSQKIFIRLTEAYEVLMDSSKKRTYDRELRLMLLRKKRHNAEGGDDSPFSYSSSFQDILRAFDLEDLLKTQNFESLLTNPKFHAFLQQALKTALKIFVSSMSAAFANIIDIGSMLSSDGLNFLNWEKVEKLVNGDYLLNAATSVAANVKDAAKNRYLTEDGQQYNWGNILQDGLTASAAAVGLWDWFSKGAEGDQKNDL